MKTRLLYLLLFTSFAFAQFPTNGLIGYYKFDSGNTLLDQAGVSQLTQTGTSLIEVTDRFNISASGAVQLNGNHLTRSNVNVTTIVTHAFWVKTNVISTTNEFILGDSDRPGAGFNSTTYGYDIILKNGQITLSSRYQHLDDFNILRDLGYGHTSNKIIADDLWHHIVVEYSADSSTKIDSKIYVDGVLDSTELYNFAGSLTESPLNTGNLVIGNNRVENLNVTNLYSDGFDDYFIYDRALTPSEVITLGTQNGFCLVPQNTILSATGVTQNSVAINISNSNLYDIAYVKASEPFSNATILSNITSSVNITGLDESTLYNVHVREQCSSGLESYWSEPIDFRTLGKIYVNDDATGLNDGSSWANAFTDLFSAFDIDIDGQEIWVAGGEYKTGSVITSFIIDKENVKLYGGFTGTETTLGDRVLGVNETILSGDNNEDDSSIIGIDATKSDNTRRILVLSEDSHNFIVDGLTITAAYSGPNGTTLCCTGGGIYNDKGDNITIRNCRFYRNAASGEGGAIFSVSGANGMTIESSVFEENYALSGGAIQTIGYSNAQASPTTINKCLFINNLSASTSAAIYARYIGNISSASVTIDACKFKGNNSRSGGAIYATSEGTATLNISITNSLFDGNISEDNSTSTANSGSSAWLRTIGATSTLTSTITNNTFVNNIDTGTANSLNNFNRSTLALTTNNASGTHNATVSNNIFYDNTTVGGATARSITGLFENLANVTVENSIDENNFSSISAGNKTNTSSSNPLFVDAINDDFTLLSTSPAIDTGNNGSVTNNLDLLNNQRIFNITVDMGAYEYGSIPVTLGNTDFEINQNQIKLYPNPTTSILNIETKETIKSVSIYSILGVKMLQVESKSIDVSSFSNGVYLTKIITESGVEITKRFIKQ